MTDELDLDAIEALANAATPGPWKVHKREPWIEYSVNTESGSGPQCWRPIDEYYNPGAATDAKFIADARAAVPTLIAEVRRLRAALEKIAVFDGLTVEGETAAQVLREGHA